MRKLRIAMASQRYRLGGGSDRVFLEEMALFREKGHQVQPIFADGELKEAQHLGATGMDFQYQVPKAASFESPSLGDVFRYIYNPAAGATMARLLADINPDLVHCHIYYGKLTSSIIREVKRRSIPLVQTLHEYKIGCPIYTLHSNGSNCEKCKGFRFYQCATNLCNRGSLSRSILSSAEAYASLLMGSVRSFDHFIAVSDFLRSKVIELGVPEDKVTTIHNFTDANLYEPSYQEGQYFLYFGRVERIKGIWDLLDAFVECRELKLIIVGDGSEAENVRRYCEENDIANVSLLGHQGRESLSSLIHGAIATIVPSLWYETFGLTITESFCHGKPVIASRIGGMAEVIEDSEDGFLFKPGDVAELIHRIRMLGKDKKLAVEMGRRGRRNVVQKFNRDMHYEKVINLYRTLGVG
ncbi:glycosyltransferase family 4 protein [Cupriavidus necator]